MVTKREIVAAQQLLIASAASVLRRQDEVETGGRVVVGDGLLRLALASLRVSYNEWNELRLSLEGEGPAVARSTSIAAAKSRLMGKQSLRRDVLVMVVAHHNKYQSGMTSEQIQYRVGGTHQTVSARVSELVNTYQLLRDSGRKQKTATGHAAIVWEPTDEARQLVAAQITGREP